MAASLDYFLRPIVTRMRGMIRRARVVRVDETRKMRELQLKVGYGDLRDTVEHLEPYGWTSRPLLETAEGLVVAVGADRAHSVALVIADRMHRTLGLGEGDIAIHPAHGATIILRANGGIEITSGADVTLSAPNLRVHGNLLVQGNVAATGDVGDAHATMAADRLVYNAHVHGGVQSGSSSTSPTPQQQ